MAVIFICISWSQYKHAYEQARTDANHAKAVTYKNSLRDVCPLVYQTRTGVQLCGAGINNVKTENKETAHTLLPVSWKEPLNQKGAEFT